jgi:hypothetical protein
LQTTEVARAFHLPLAALADPARLRAHELRRTETVLYWAINVGDLVSAGHGEGEEMEWKRDEERDEVGSGRDGMIEAWGE